ncbi:hypothetical protein BT69DRAFT_1355087 [Atractiella rhizophila]|nr:hypothetical protein BT69DRAFT_1355087 [Atractiella rhizophila]
MSSETLSLNCWIRGTDRREIFDVEISSSKTVMRLRKAIKDENPISFRDVDAKMLILYKVALRMDALEESMKVALNQGESLEPLSQLSEIFVDPPASNHIHILIDAPRSLRLRVEPLSNEHSLEQLDVGAQRRAFLETNPSERPSTAGKLEAFMNRQSHPNTMIYCNRPETAAATIPPTLLHPVFGTFLDKCESHEVTLEDNALARELCSAVSDFYPNEDRRAEAIHDIFANHGIHLIPSDIKQYRTDGDISGRGLSCTIAEFKNEIGNSGAEPYAQGILYYLESTRDYAVKLPDSALPCMLVFIFGPYIAFAGAVWNLRPIVQSLSFTRPLHHHLTDTNIRRKLACHLGAFRTTISALDRYYRGLPQTDGPRLSTRQLQLYPYPTTFTPLNGGNPLDFEYALQPHPKKLVFFCNQLEQELCVKFVRHYSREVHLKCASRGLAPKLRGFEELSGGWKMVVMDRLRPEEYMELYQPEVTPTSALMDTIESKLTELHQQHYVHGDIRESNILVSLDGKQFMLVDFDWAGKTGEVRYPMNVNRGPGLWRPDGAVDGQLILPDHDMQMLARIRRDLRSKLVA